MWKMPTKLNLKNRKFGQLKVLKEGHKRKKVIMWKCLCSCGKTKEIASHSLIRGSTKSCGCKKFPNLINQKFNKLLVIKYVGKRLLNDGKYVRIWKCKCDCGSLKNVSTSYLISNHTKSCGCSRKKYEDITMSSKLALYNSYKSHANSKNRIFNLSFKEFIKLTSQNCYYCNDTPRQIMQANQSNKNSIYYYNGVDRINNKKGYTKKNSIPCCKICNKAKHILSQEEFFYWIKSISTNLKKRNLI